MIDLNQALTELQHSAGRSVGPGPDQAVVARRRRRRAVRRTTTAAAGLAATAAVVLGGAALLEDRPVVVPPASSPPSTPPVTPDPTQEPTEEPAPSVPAPETPPAPEAPTDPGPTLPLPGLVERFDGSSSIAVPEPPPGSPLADGEYVGRVSAADLSSTATLTVELRGFYGGDEARQWLLEHEPEALIDGDPPNGYWLTDDDPTVLSLPVSPDLRVAPLCQVTDGARPEVVELDPAAWAAGGGESSMSCPSLLDLYWLDVRDGVVVQAVGQYLP